MRPADVVVTNFNRNFTGVSATISALYPYQAAKFEMTVVGKDLPNANALPLVQAIGLARLGPATQSCQIWHVRRNSEMQFALFVRDVLRFPIKIVFTSAAQRLHSRWPRWLISRMDTVIATTEKAAEFVENVRAVIPHGVDTTTFEPAPSRTIAWQETGYPGLRGVVTLGRVRPEKGTDVFVDTMLQVLPDRPDVTALVVGATSRSHQSFQQELMRKISDAGLAKRIIFTGELSQEKVRKLLPAASALVALPRYEGYGLTPIEAMACGTPIIASDTGYFRAFIGEHSCGAIVPIEDSNAACDSLAKLFDDPVTSANWSKSARARAVHEFEISQEAEAISKVYHELWQAG